MARGLLVMTAGTIGLTLGGAAGAQCVPGPGPLVANTPSETPYVARYNALAAEDPYSLTDKTAARWRALVDEMQRDGHASVPLVVRSQMMLAGSLQGDAATARGLAAAQGALALAEANGITNGPLHAALLAMLAARETQAGKAAQAVAHADAALAETERVDGKESWAYGSAANIASSAYYSIADFSRSEQLSAIALRLAVQCLPPDVSIIGSMMNSHAADLVASGRLEEGLVANERAVAWEVAHLSPSDPNVPPTLATFGWNLFQVGRLREGEAVMRRAADLYARFQPDDIAGRALTLFMFGQILYREGKYREAAKIWQVDAALYARIKDHLAPLEGSGLLRMMAVDAQRRGNLDEAIALRQREVAQIENGIHRPNLQLARARIEYASTLAMAGRTREALTIAEPAMAMLGAVAPPKDPKRIVTEIMYAHVALAGGADPTTAYAAAAAAAARMEAMLLDAATSRGDLINYAPIFTAGFATVARLALAAHNEEAAFHALQLANLSEVAVVNADVTARGAAAEPQVNVLIERLEALGRDRHQLDRERVAANVSGDASKVAAASAAIKRNEEEVATATSALDGLFPAYRTLRRPQPVTLAAFRAGLNADEIVLAPLTLPGETLVIAVTREGLRWTTVVGPQSHVTALVARVRASVDAGRQDFRARFDTAAARALGAIVLPAALTPAIGTHRHLVYYAAGALATVPPALLVTGPPRRGAAPAWLIRSHSISIATSLVSRVTTSRPTRDGFLGVGAPALDGKPLTVAMRGITIKMGDFGKTGVTALPALPHAANELRAIGAMFPPGQQRLLIGAGATKAAFRALPLASYGVIAFATHGLVADALPGLTQPALVLTPPARDGDRAGDDGLLTAGEIAGLHLDADWVILSACDTAGDSDPQSGSYSGLTSAFILAGARALLVSHWPVRDDAAERLTVATVHAARLGMDRSTALQHAMLALMRDRSVRGSSNPAIWAPFVLVE